MPSKNHYNLVSDDEYDSRIPLHTEEAIQHGLTFHKIKYIGSLDIPRPRTRVEIIAAMRRIRYEFKAKGMKKKKVDFFISLGGIKVTHSKRTNMNLTDEKLNLIMHHPLHRVFYTSHDSNELKIFSFISRDSGTNVFRSHVFKATSKNQAIKVVRTVGQAFEVGFKQATPTPASNINGEVDDPPMSLELVTNFPEVPKISPTLSPAKPLSTSSKASEEQEKQKPLSMIGEREVQSGVPLSIRHQIEALQKEAAVKGAEAAAARAEVESLRARLQAEAAHNAQLTAYNTQLLEQIYRLVAQLRHLENKVERRNSDSPDEWSSLLHPLPLPSAHPEAEDGQSCNIKNPLALEKPQETFQPSNTPPS